jgi:hypothetical protein
MTDTTTVSDPPALIPWAGFDLNHPSRVAAACRQRRHAA